MSPVEEANELFSTNLFYLSCLPAGWLRGGQSYMYLSRLTLQMYGNPKGMESNSFVVN